MKCHCALETVLTGIFKTGQLSSAGLLRHSDIFKCISRWGNSSLKKSFEITKGRCSAQRQRPHPSAVSRSYLAKMYIGPAMFLAVIFFLSFSGIVVNALMQIVLRKLISIHPPTKLLFRCLTMTDFCIALAVLLLICNAPLLLSTFPTETRWGERVMHHIREEAITLVYVFSGFSLKISTVISVDRLLALLLRLRLRLRYRHVVTLSRVRVAAICLALATALVGFVCLFCSHRIFMTLVFTETVICFITSLLSYRLRYSLGYDNISLEYKTFSVEDNRAKEKMN